MTASAMVDTLNGAVKILQKYGWRKDAYGNRIFGYCLLGAVDISVRRGNHRHMRETVREDTIQAIREHLTHLGYYLPASTGAGGISWWNDCPERIKEEVINVLQGTTEMIKGKQDENSRNRGSVR